jgi:NADPH:quinone reductase-like Zn-dependent oxidoreductase
VVKVLDGAQAAVRWWIGRQDIKFDSVLMKADGDELEKIRGWVEEGKIKPVVGKVLSFDQLELIKEECERIRQGRGGLGKLVIDIRDVC